MSSIPYIDEMLIALKANIEYLQNEGNQQIKITNGIYLKSAGDFHIYKFDLPPLKEVDIDQDIEVRISFNSVSGRVIASDSDTIEISLEKNIGETIPEAYLVISSFFLLQKLYDKLAEINEGRLVISDKASKLFGLQEFSTSYASDYDLPLVTKNNLDEDKIAALRLSIGSEISFVWGPPGTGKTQLIAAIIEALTSKNQSVLLLSHTNKATDGALLRTVKHFKKIDSTIYTEGKILRVGKIFDKDLKKYQEITPEYAVKLKSRALVEEVNTLSSIISDYEDQVGKITETIAKCDKLARLKKMCDEANGELERAKLKSHELRSDFNSVKKQITDNEEKIKKYHKSNFFSRMLLGLNLEKLTKDQSELVLQKGHVENLIKEHNNKVKYADGVKNESQEQVDLLIHEIGDLNYSEIKGKLDILNTEISNRQKERDKLLQKIDELSVTIVKEALVVGTTLTKSYTSKIILSRPYDCVIIDEASMAPIPMVWCAAGLANKSITIIGDFLQLPPITQYKQLKEKSKTQEQMQLEEACVNRWLKDDIFHFLGLPQAIEKGEKPTYLKQLTYQYRMHPDIADLINTLVYGTYGEEYKLKSDQSTISKEIVDINKEPIAGYHLGIVDTSDYGTIAIRTDGGSRYNIYHALLAIELAKRAVDSGYSEIGIICPFRAQVNLIKEMLNDLVKEKPELREVIVADTVHKYQGDEKQIIIFDTVTGDQTRLTDDNLEHGQDEQLMNVAFSRAKEKCVVLTDVTKVEKKHSESSVLRQLIQYCRGKKDPIIRSKGILKDYPVNDAEEQWLKKLNKQTITKEFHQAELFNQDSFYPAFIKDIFTTNNELMIVSPFLTHERTNAFLPIFEHLIRNNINIFVITRTPRLQEGSLKQQSVEVIKELEDKGVIVLPLAAPIHQKLAVIDRRILWEGSLNILSQRNSIEIMRRFEGEESCKQLLSFLGFDKNIGKIGENRLVRCEFCTKPGAWYWTDKSIFGGYWTHCLIGNHKIGKEPLTEGEVQDKKKKLTKLRSMKKQYTGDGTPICPEHEVQMIRKKGKWGKDFWGCPKYPRCRVTEKML